MSIVFSSCAENSFVYGAVAYGLGRISGFSRPAALAGLIASDVVITSMTLELIKKTNLSTQRKNDLYNLVGHSLDLIMPLAIKVVGQRIGVQVPSYLYLAGMIISISKFLCVGRSLYKCYNPPITSVNNSR